MSQGLSSTVVAMNDQINAIRASRAKLLAYAQMEELVQRWTEEFGNREVCPSEAAFRSLAEANGMPSGARTAHVSDWLADFRRRAIAEAGG